MALAVRVGSKQRIAQKIISFFPSHDVYIEPFGGVGGVFFHKTPVAYNYINDSDMDLFNLLQFVSGHKDFDNAFEQLLEAHALLPYHIDFFKLYTDKHYEPKNDLDRALMFLVRSNWGFLGKWDTMKFGIENSKKMTEKRLKDVALFFKKYGNSIAINNCDWLKFMESFSLRDDMDKRRILVYLDPPYCETFGGTYESGGFSKDDTEALFSYFSANNYRTAISEFETDFTKEMAKKYGFQMIVIGERQNLKDRQNEVLFVNYKTVATSNKIFDHVQKRFVGRAV